MMIKLDLQESMHAKLMKLVPMVSLNVFVKQLETIMSIYR
jgi:hypothetical protein